MPVQKNVWKLIECTSYIYHWLHQLLRNSSNVHRKGMNCNWIYSVNFFYFTYDMDLRFLPSDPVCFDKQSPEGDHVIATRPDLDRMQKIRVERGTRSRSEVSDVSDDTACKRVQALAPQAPGRRYGTGRSLLSEYMSLHLSLTKQKTVGPFRK